MADELQKTLIDRAADDLEGVGTGIVKGAVRMPLDAGSMMRHTPLVGRLLRKLSGDPDDKLYEAYRQSWSPDGVAEGIGYSGEKLGELLLGMGRTGSVLGEIGLGDLLKSRGMLAGKNTPKLDTFDHIDYISRMAHGAYNKLRPAVDGIFGRKK